ncbi:putative signal peptide-containing protein [Cryptosporidium canis]|uniref:Signal peptide-containing protein n=1 Tax=Cryptosporidium canis TaxID=195482 RepID=A0ABQ8P991_9CRYT|nr:putative signal peptide-containing protein [Cryptosporidium canis]
MCTIRKSVLLSALLFFLELIFSFGISNFEGYSSSGNGKLTVSSYSEYSQQACEPSAVPLRELMTFGRAEVVQFSCPEGHQISGIQYITDSMELYVTGIRFICNDKSSSIYMGSENFSPKNVKRSYLDGGINEVAFGYDAEAPILRLIQVIKEEALPKGSTSLLSFISPSEQLFRSQTFVGSIPTSLCAVILKDSAFKAPVIGNIRIKFLEKRPLSQHRYRGLVYTGVPRIEFSKPDVNRCKQIGGVSPSNTKDLNFHVNCPDSHRIIGIDVVAGNKITASTLESVSSQLNKLIKPSGSKNDQTDFSEESGLSTDPLIDSLGYSTENSSSEEPNIKEGEEDISVNNGEILMTRFLCSDYISSFSIGQALKNVTSWNLQDQIPNVKDWEFSSILVGDDAEAMMRDAAEQKLVLGTAEVRLGNINSVLLGYTTEKLLIKAYLKDSKHNQEISEYVERFTFGPVFINANEFIDHDLKMRNILRSLPQIYKSNPIDNRFSFSGDEIGGLCGRIMHGSMLISSIGFEVSKNIKPYYPQIITTANVKFDKGLGCGQMLKLVAPREAGPRDENAESREVRSTLRSFQGSIECPSGQAVERIQLLVKKSSGLIASIRFYCGNDLENYFTIGEASLFEHELISLNKNEAAKGKDYEVINTIVPSSNASYDEITSITVSTADYLNLNSILIPQTSLPISLFQVAQKTSSPAGNQESTMNGLRFVSDRYPPDSQRRKIWSNGVLTKVCLDVTPGGLINNIGFGFSYPFQPTSRKNISSYYGFSSEGNGELDVDSKAFTCPGMLHSPRAQLLFRKQTEEIIMTGELQSRSKKTMLRSINFRCPEKSVINRVEVSWQLIRGMQYSPTPDEGSNNGSDKGPLGSVGAMRFFCSDGKSVFKVGSDATPTHSKSNMEINEVMLGYKDLNSDEIAAVRRELSKENTIQVTEELLRSLPGDPVAIKLVHESRPLSKVQLDVEGVRSYGSAVEALNSLKIRRKPTTYKSRIWRGGKWTGVCIGLLNLGGGILKNHEFSIVSFGSYFEKPPPLAALAYKGYIQTGTPQVHENKVVSTCDLTAPPSFGLKYPGYSAAFLCPNGTHIERIGYSTFEKHSKEGLEMLGNGTVTLPHPFREQKHIGPLGQITAIQLFCSDGISTVNIGQPSKTVSISKPGEIGAVKIGYVRPNSSLLDKNVSLKTLLMPASIEITSRSGRQKLIKYSNPNFPDYTQKVSTWEGEDLQAVCVDFAILDDKRGSKEGYDQLKWTGSTLKYPEKHIIMSIGFAFKRRTVRRSRRTPNAPKTIKVEENIPKVRLKTNKSVKGMSHRKGKYS